MQIENLRIEFVSQIAQIEKQCFDTPWSEKSLLEEIENANSKFYVLIDNEKVVGYGSFHKVADFAEIMNIAVDKNFRGKGYSNLILNKMLSEAKKLNLTEIQLEVKSINYVAISLYEKYGFAIVGKRAKYYPDGNDAILMTKHLEK